MIKEKSATKTATDQKKAVSLVKQLKHPFNV